MAVRPESDRRSTKIFVVVVGARAYQGSFRQYVPQVLSSFKMASFKWLCTRCTSFNRYIGEGVPTTKGRNRNDKAWRTYCRRDPIAGIFARAGQVAYGPTCSVVVGCGDVVVVGCLAAVIALLLDVVVVVVVALLVCDVLVVSHRSSSAGKIF